MSTHFIAGFAGAGVIAVLPLLGSTADALITRSPVPAVP